MLDGSVLVEGPETRAAFLGDDAAPLIDRLRDAGLDATDLDLLVARGTDTASVEALDDTLAAWHDWRDTDVRHPDFRPETAAYGVDDLLAKLRRDLDALRDRVAGLFGRGGGRDEPDPAGPYAAVCDAHGVDADTLSQEGLDYPDMDVVGLAGRSAAVVPEVVTHDGAYSAVFAGVDGESERRAWCDHTRHRKRAGPYVEHDRLDLLEHPDCTATFAVERPAGVVFNGMAAPGDRLDDRWSDRGDNGFVLWTANDGHGRSAVGVSDDATTVRFGTESGERPAATLPGVREAVEERGTLVDTVADGVTEGRDPQDGRAR